MRLRSDFAEVEEVESLVEGDLAVEERIVRSEKFRMARRSEVRLRSKAPVRMNGIHRRRRKKIRI